MGITLHLAVLASVDTAEVIDDFNRLVHEQGRLVDHCDADEMAREVETGGGHTAELLREGGAAGGGGLEDEFADEARLFEVADDERGGETA